MGTATIWNKNEEQNYGQSMETKSPAPRETTRVGEQKESPSFSWWVDQRLKRTQEYQKMKMKFQQSASSQKNEIRKRKRCELQRKREVCSSLEGFGMKRLCSLKRTQGRKKKKICLFFKIRRIL